jgi:hypothetical protein
MRVVCLRELGESSAKTGGCGRTTGYSYLTGYGRVADHTDGIASTCRRHHRTSAFTRERRRTAHLRGVGDA